jgi:TolB-like protein
LKRIPFYKKFPVILFCLVGFPLAAMAEPVKVAVLPFAIHAEKDYAFLQKGITEMMTSRISSPGKVAVVDPLSTAQAVEEAREHSGDSLALLVGARLKADFAIHGSITVLGDSVSIDAKMLDVTGTRPPMTFFKQTQGMGEVIPQINLMATEINSQVFGVQPPAHSPAPAAAAPQPPVASDQHRHPERLLQDGRFADPGVRPIGPPADQDGQPHPLNPAFATARGMQAGADEGFWKSRTYNYLINAIAVGDVDNDGLLETVVAAPDKIFIFRFSHGRQQTVAEIESGRYTRNISVDIADINGNGTPEIFVTAFSVAMNTLESYVLEFDGQAFRPIVEKSRYYFSVSEHPTLGKILLGQRQISNESTPFEAPVFQMEWDGAEYATTRQILPARLGNVLGLAYGDILNDGGESVAAYNPDDLLRVVSTNGKVQWTSSDNYGGTPLYFALPPPTPGDSPYQFYLPTRIRTADLQQNRKYEVLVANNQDTAGRRLAQRRLFNKGVVEALVWDGLGLTPAWRTRQFSGRIQDFLIADFNNDGTRNLLVALITKEGSIIFTDAQSTLVAFDLNIP